MIEEIRNASSEVSPSNSMSDITENASSTAKVLINSENESNIRENLSHLSESLSEEPVPSEILESLKRALFLDNSGSTGYAVRMFDDGKHTLRLSDHSMNAKNNKKKSEKRNFESVVIRVAKRSRFSPSDSVEAIEYVYHPKLMTKEKALAIVSGIQNWLKEGEFNAEADRVTYSLICSKRMGGSSV